MRKQRGSKYQQYDNLIRQMCSDGANLTQIANELHAHREDIRYYIDQNNIPHEPFVSARRMEKNGRWNGGKIIDEDGYVLIKSPQHPFSDRHNYVREHRLVMEKHLGRYLHPHEVVHHIDNDKQNNAIGNLELFARNCDHLAKSLAGKVPKWTDDGKRRILEGVHRSARSRRKPTP